MSEKEKKVIEYLKNYCNTDLLYEQKHYDYINFLIKSFEKQQKQIERLKYDKDFLYGVIDELKGVNNE